MGVKPKNLLASQPGHDDKYAYVTMFLVKEKGGVINLVKSEKEEASSLLEGVPPRPRDRWPDSVLDLADNLKEVGSKYPLVVYTNSDMLLMKNITDFYPNLVVYPVREEDRLKMKCQTKTSHDTHYQKLMIFNQTQYSKLVWMDIDIALTKNIDNVFDKDTNKGSAVFGQVDDYQCDGNGLKSSTAGGFCSALMVFQPSKLAFDGLMKEQKSMNYCWGDQAIIHNYFTKQGRKANLLSRDIVDFEHCNKKAAALHFSGSPKAKRHMKVKARHLV